MVEKKITVMIQVRSGSTRLPKKALKKIEGKPIIWHMINRVKKIKSVAQKAEPYYVSIFVPFSVCTI